MLTIMPRTPVPTRYAKVTLDERPTRVHEAHFERLFIDYLATIENAHTRRAYELDLRALWDFTLGDMSTQALANYRHHLMTTKEARSCARSLGTARRFIDYMISHGVDIRNPLLAKEMASPKVDKTQSPYIALTDAEVRRMLDAPDRSTYTGACQRLALVFGFYLGLRVSEIVRVRASDIIDGRLHVLGKGGKLRVLPLDELVLDEIRAFVDLSLIFGRWAGESDENLFKSKFDPNKAVDTRTVERWFTEAAVKMGLEKHVTPHSARATAVTKALDEGSSLRDVGNFAGHSSLDTTMMYDKRRGEASEKVIKKIKY